MPATKDITLTPWARVDVDLIGPYTVKTSTGVHHLRAMTMIDPATRWFEIKAIENPTSHEAMEAFNNTWLSRYPRHTYVGYEMVANLRMFFVNSVKTTGLLLNSRQIIIHKPIVSWNAYT